MNCFLKSVTRSLVRHAHDRLPTTSNRARSRTAVAARRFGAKVRTRALKLLKGINVMRLVRLSFKYGALPAAAAAAHYTSLERGALSHALNYHETHVV
jgi:hypothetical protein